MLNIAQSFNVLTTKYYEKAAQRHSQKEVKQ